MKIVAYQGKSPKVDKDAFIAPNAVLIGDVTVEKGANIWFGAVLRGDLGKIVVKKGASIQDNTVVHGLPEGQTIIGENAVIGHGAVLHNCTIGRDAVIGINAVVLDHAEVGDRTVIGAGSVVTSKTKIPAGHLATGSPAKIKKKISESSLWYTRQRPLYKDLCNNYLAEGTGRVTS